MLPRMILRPKSPAALRMTPALTSVVAVPTWLRRAVPDAQSLGPKGLDDIAIAAGAAIGALDAVVRRQERWAGAWRQRLALGAAAVATRQAGRVEDEAALRDAVLLTRPGDDVGPAGHMLLAWRRLAARPAEELLTGPSIATCSKPWVSHGMSRRRTSWPTSFGNSRRPKARSECWSALCGRREARPSTHRRMLVRGRAARAAAGLDARRAADRRRSRRRQWFWPAAARVYHPSTQGHRGGPRTRENSARRAGACGVARYRPVSRHRAPGRPPDRRGARTSCPRRGRRRRSALVGRRERGVGEDRRHERP